MKSLTPEVFVSGQIQLADLERIAGFGIRTLINNRPDGEMAGQPLSADLQVEAKKQGLSYIHLPMAGGVSSDLIVGSVSAYQDSETPVLAFCGSGTRSTVLWCFANVENLGVDSVLQTAANTGYNLEQIRAPLEAYLTR